MNLPRRTMTNPIGAKTYDAYLYRTKTYDAFINKTHDQSDWPWRGLNKQKGLYMCECPIWYAKVEDVLFNYVQFGIVKRTFIDEQANQNGHLYM